MGRVTGWILLALAAFMFIGYLNADVGGPAAIAALLIAVVLPAAGGIALIRGGRAGGAGRLTARREELRQETLQAELLRLAGRHAGRLTIVEAVTALAITPEEAKHALDELAVRGLADFEVTDSGVVVYAFYDVQKLGDKHTARKLLD